MPSVERIDPSGGLMRERRTTVKTRCRACGSYEVRSRFTGIMVIRECAACETRIGSYEVKTVPHWAKGECVAPPESGADA